MAVGMEKVWSSLPILWGSACNTNGEEGTGWSRRMAVKEVAENGQLESDTWMTLVSTTQKTCFCKCCVRNKLKSNLNSRVGGRNSFRMGTAGMESQWKSDCRLLEGKTGLLHLVVLRYPTGCLEHSKALINCSFKSFRTRHHVISIPCINLGRSSLSKFMSTKLLSQGLENQAVN